MATVDEPEWDISAVLRRRMDEQEYTIERLAKEIGVQPRTIQGWRTEGRRPRGPNLAKVENILGDLGPPTGHEVTPPPSIAYALKRLRAAERALNEAQQILRRLQR